jgi:hypothetical protein
MRQFFGTFVLALASVFGILTAWLAATRPGNFAARLGLAISNAGGINEVRAQYAGFFLAVSLSPAGWSMAPPATRRPF